MSLTQKQFDTWIEQWDQVRHGTGRLMVLDEEGEKVCCALGKLALSLGIPISPSDSNSYEGYEEMKIYDALIDYIDSDLKDIMQLINDEEADSEQIKQWICQHRDWFIYGVPEGADV